MVEIDWTSKESLFLYNSKLSLIKNFDFKDIIKICDLNGHIFIATSGSTAMNPEDIKFVALKKLAILESAKSVVDHLEYKSNDTILNILPYFHISGLANYARSYISGCKIVDLYSDNLKWNPHYFVSEAQKINATITSLVPTQIFDIVKENLKSPKSLRAVVVGGGAISFDLYVKARELFWNILPSYGMTECGSQIATAAVDFVWDSEFPKLDIMKHLIVKINETGNICIAGNSLFSGYLLINDNKLSFKDFQLENLNENTKIKPTKFLETSDIGSIIDNKLCVYGRGDNVVKVLGESVSLGKLNSILDAIKLELNLKYDVIISSIKDERCENKIIFIFEEECNFDLNKLRIIIDEFNKKVFPFEKAKIFYLVKNIPKTSLGKIKSSQLLNLIKNSCFYEL
ncbi:AMP-binding protein [Spirobacillus cienkowskii]|jgi:O-succinylbenzoic acid--CoA ligase|uniref:AMP-dependent synthetase/ligase domain-containing protein n=1 Tax=Spirobacillus cienkowskii TaxID=495820 RepID=A0A369KU81_9BACT|nr:MAG: hypothetical protein DCC88_01345 [Spirobacillus cienkowskii]